ncbi:MAG: hypothetical protein ACK56F_27640, partial [bacterium]
QQQRLPEKQRHEDAKRNACGREGEGLRVEDRLDVLPEGTEPVPPDHQVRVRRRQGIHQQGGPGADQSQDQQDNPNQPFLSEYEPGVRPGNDLSLQQGVEHAPHRSAQNLGHEARALEQPVGPREDGGMHDFGHGPQ